MEFPCTSGIIPWIYIKKKSGERCKNTDKKCQIKADKTGVGLGRNLGGGRELLN